MSHLDPTQNDVETIELSIQEAQKGIDRAQRLENLHKNRDFKALILTGLFEEHAQQLVHMLGEPAVKRNEAIRADIVADMEMIANLRQYFRKIFQQADTLKMEKESLQAELDMVAAES